jgi:SAM-dependent methyltransferase
MSNNGWAYTLYVEHPELYLPFLESLKDQAKDEVIGLSRLFKVLEVPSGSKILDVSCGIGRHSMNLAKLGYEVIGYDPSPLYIEMAKVWVESELSATQSKIRLYQGDTNSILDVLKENDETGFQVIISMFNSLGCVGEKEDRALLRDVASLASEGAVLITETENRDWRLRNFQPYISYEFNGLVIHESWKFNQENSIFEGRSRFYKKSNNGDLSLLLDLKDRNLRLYSLHELKDILHCSGWKYVKSYGSIRTLEPSTNDTAELVIVCRKFENS